MESSICTVLLAVLVIFVPGSWVMNKEKAASKVGEYFQRTKIRLRTCMHLYAYDSLSSRQPSSHLIPKEDAGWLVDRSIFKRMQKAYARCRRRRRQTLLDAHGKPQRTCFLSCRIVQNSFQQVSTRGGKYIRHKRRTTWCLFPSQLPPSVAQEQRSAHGYRK